MTVEPFRIDIADGELRELTERLSRTRWPTSVVDDWSEGTPLGFMHDLVDYWREHFDWRGQEAGLNALDQVTVEVDDATIHAVHERGVGPDPLPLVLTHGWPSTFTEFRQVITPLADPGAHGGDPADAFHVVVPSLPGYGFSSIPTAPGSHPRRMAAQWADLMSALGYDRFAAHGCDWGAHVTALLGLDFPDRLVGIHMGMVSLRGHDPDGSRTPPPEVDEAFRRRARGWQAAEQGYVAIQSTKPLSLSYGLADSPAGLAAWIAEKWRAWVDSDGDLFKVIGRDELLTTISIYWFTNTIASANRLYREGRQNAVELAPGQRVEVPAGFLLEQPGDERDRSRNFLEVPRIGAPPRERAERAFADVQRWTVSEQGGHFPAMETPELFVDEIRELFRPLRA